MDSISKAAKIMYAHHEGIYVLQLVGDIRLTLCTTFDAFLEKMLVDVKLSGVLIDLNRAVALDSTTLGLLAKIAVKMQEKNLPPPMILSTNSGINLLLDGMGFKKIFYIITASMFEMTSDYELTESPSEPISCLEKVLEAHRVLMNLNDKNHDTFKSVVAILEAEKKGGPWMQSDRHF